SLTDALPNLLGGRIGGRDAAGEGLAPNGGPASASHRAADAEAEDLDDLLPPDEGDEELLWLEPAMNQRRCARWHGERVGLLQGSSHRREHPHQLAQADRRASLSDPLGDDDVEGPPLEPLEHDEGDELCSA